MTTLFYTQTKSDSEKLACDSHLIYQEPERALQLSEHPIEGHQQHLSRTHFRRVLYRALHVPRLYQLRVLDTQNPGTGTRPSRLTSYDQ